MEKLKKVRIFLENGMQVKSEENYIIAKKAVLQNVYSKENKIVKDALKSYVRRKGYV